MSEKVLVTGAGGYIGRHVIDALSPYDCEILVASLGHLPPDSRYSVISQPIFDTDSPDLYQALGAPDRCIHLAWKDGFDHNSDAHIKYLPSHISFVETMMESGIKSISVMGSMHEIGYWEGKIGPETPANPLTLYGIAKNALRQASLLFSRQTGAKLKWLRAYYITGDDMHNHSVFSKISEKVRAGEKTFPFTSGKNKYDFVDVDLLAQQIVAATMQDDVDGIIECCSGKPVSLGDRVNEYINQHGYNIKLDYGVFPDRPYDSPAVWGDSTQIEKIMSGNTL